MGGYYKNNINKTISNKIKFLSQYKFSIAMENIKGDGYISEKIIDSFNAGTIPIYLGDFQMNLLILKLIYLLKELLILTKKQNLSKEKIKMIIYTYLSIKRNL